MLWRAAVIVIGGGFVAYRVALWLEIRKARRAGDVERERRLRSRGFGLLRWAVLCLVVFIVVLTVLVWRESG